MIRGIRCRLATFLRIPATFRVFLSYFFVSRRVLIHRGNLAIRHFAGVN